MVAGGQAEAFVGLSHQVADKNLGSRRLNDGLRNAANQQVRNQAGEERARTDGDQVGIRDGFQRLGKWPHIGRH